MGDLQIFQALFCLKIVFFIGVVCKCLCVSNMIDSFNGIGFPLFALSYF